MNESEVMKWIRHTSKHDTFKWVNEDNFENSCTDSIYSWCEEDECQYSIIWSTVWQECCHLQIAPSYSHKLWNIHVWIDLCIVQIDVYSIILFKSSNCDNKNNVWFVFIPWRLICSIECTTILPLPLCVMFVHVRTSFTPSFCSHYLFLSLCLRFVIQKSFAVFVLVVALFCSKAIAITWHLSTWSAFARIYLNNYNPRHL